MEPKIFFTTIPKLIELKYYKVDINPNIQEDSVLRGYFNSQKIVARRIIVERENYLAAPIKGNFTQIHLILPIESFDYDDVFLWAKKMKLNLNGPYSLHDAIYLECVHYTLTVKISPNWNQIQNFYVKQSIFSNSCEPIDAVQLQMLITGGSFCMIPKPVRLKMTKINVSDFETNVDRTDESNVIHIRKNVFILPDLKPAIAYKIYFKLPYSCPFSEYSNIKEYWKILHGYELPENGKDMIYVAVSFTGNTTTYIYPIVCVYSQEPRVLRSKDESVVLKEFYSVVCKRFPKICNYALQLKIRKNDFYRPTAKLHSASEVFFYQPNSIKCGESEKEEGQRKCKGALTKPSENTKDSKLEFSAPRFSTITPKTLNETFKCSQKFTAKHKISSRVKRPFNPAKKLKFNTGNSEILK